MDSPSASRRLPCLTSSVRADPSPSGTLVYITGDVRRTSDKKTGGGRKTPLGSSVVMPKIVNWDERRDEILSATWRVIARDGIAKATIRAIAREAHCSPGILAHYFGDKADILGAALVLSHRRVTARMDARAAGLATAPRQRQMLSELLGSFRPQPGMTR